MAKLTIRLSDEKQQRLRQLGEPRRISMNKLIEELSTRALTELTPKPDFAHGPRWAHGRRDWRCWTF